MTTLEKHVDRSRICVSCGAEYAMLLNRKVCGCGHRCSIRRSDAIAAYSHVKNIWPHVPLTLEEAICAYDDRAVSTLVRIGNKRTERQLIVPLRTGDSIGKDFIFSMRSTVACARCGTSQHLKRAMIVALVLGFMPLTCSACDPEPIELDPTAPVFRLGEVYLRRVKEVVREERRIVKRVQLNLIKVGDLLPLKDEYGEVICAAKVTVVVPDKNMGVDIRVTCERCLRQAKWPHNCYLKERAARLSRLR